MRCFLVTVCAIASVFGHKHGHTHRDHSIPMISGPNFFFHHLLAPLLSPHHFQAWEGPFASALRHHRPFHGIEIKEIGPRIRIRVGIRGFGRHGARALAQHPHLGHCMLDHSHVCGGTTLDKIFSGAEGSDFGDIFHGVLNAIQCFAEHNHKLSRSCRRTVLAQVHPCASDFSRHCSGATDPAACISEKSKNFSHECSAAMHLAQKPSALPRLKKVNLSISAPISKPERRDAKAIPIASGTTSTPEYKNIIKAASDEKYSKKEIGTSKVASKISTTKPHHLAVPHLLSTQLLSQLAVTHTKLFWASAVFFIVLLITVCAVACRVAGRHKIKTERVRLGVAQGLPQFRLTTPTGHEVSD